MENIYQFRYPASPWSILGEVAPQGTLGLERAPQYIYVDIHGAEIAEIRERISKLEERLTQAGEQQRISIQFLESEKLQLKQPLSVSCVYSPQSNIYIVDHFELNIYGEGRDEKEAVSDFKLSLEETYFDLKKDKDKLGPSLQREWQLLSKIVEEK